MAADSDTDSTPTLLNSIQLNLIKFSSIQLYSVSFHEARPARIRLEEPEVSNQEET